MNRPDFSEYVVHFTKDAPALGADAGGERNKALGGMSARDRLFSILSSRSIWATPMPWTNLPAVCFTECTWKSLHAHAEDYSKFGLGFRKKTLFWKGGGPAIYLRQDLYAAQRAHCMPPFAPEVWSFVTPFAPAYGGKGHGAGRDKKPVDFTHEREWRVPHDYGFDLADVEFVIVGSYEDMAKAPRELKDGIGRSKWLIMDNYASIERFWPSELGLHTPAPGPKSSPSGTAAVPQASSEQEKSP